MCKTQTDFYKKINYPVSVRKQRGAAGADTLLNGCGSLQLQAGGFVVFDMGAASVGGYPAFRVQSFCGTLQLHISYSDRFEPYRREETMAKGDFTRGSCTYLGVELPVMPANPYRFEEYSVGRCGLYLYPLIQGQERFVCIAAEGEGEVCLSEFFITDDSAPVLPVGSFESDSEKLNRIWLASARTLRLATVQANQWESVCGKICLRKLTKWRGGGLCERVIAGHLRLECVFQLSLNPEHETGMGVLFFAKSENEGYALRITKNGEIALERRGERGTERLSSVKISPLVDNLPVRLRLESNERGVCVHLNGERVLVYEGAIAARGTFGFFMESEWRAMVDELSVFENDVKAYEWQGDLGDFSLRRSGFFISDGAKRDRLPWTGDLDWAFDCGWYAFGERMDALNTLDILALHQTPEGFIHGACYPENVTPPASGDYGDYQSDMFAAWFVVSALTYYELSGNLAVGRYFTAMRRCTDYLWGYVDSADGLFEQRFETSKGLWDHCLGDTGKNTYTNLMILDAFERLAKFCRVIGEFSYADVCATRAQILRKSIFAFLYDEAQGGFVKRKDWRELCDMANPYAMGKHMVNARQAAQIAAHAERVTHAYGKVTVLMIRGLYDYGYAEQAQNLLFGKLPLYLHGGLYSYVDWFSALDHPDLPETVYECMHMPPYNFGDNLNWGDLSHPDSGICGVISSRIAGVMPLDAGFSKVLLKPNPGACGRIECRVPTAHGIFEATIECGAAGSRVTVNAPPSVTVETDFSALAQPVSFEKNGERAVLNNKEVI